MGQFDLLRYVVRILEELGLKYFVTGSTATLFYGEPRFTNDIDVVVALYRRQKSSITPTPTTMYISRLSGGESLGNRNHRVDIGDCPFMHHRETDSQAMDRWNEQGRFKVALHRPMRRLCRVYRL
jgi:hypothetical protein